MEVNSQNRYFNLRHLLAELNYPGSFGSDSIDLVERLVNDITATTSSYKQVQERESRLSADLNLAQAQLFPLRKDNTRLTRENHQLHIDSIKQKDDLALALDDQKREIRSLEDRLNEIKYVNIAKDKEMRAMEKEKERMREAYEYVSDPSTKKRGIKGNMQLTTLLPPSPINDSELQKKKQVEIDARIIASLREQLDRTNETLKRSQEEGFRLSAGLEARETELAKTMTFEEEVDPQGISQSSKLFQIQASEAANKRIIGQLNSQVDFLNEQLALREAQLVEVADRILKAEVKDTLSLLCLSLIMS
jgi:chromosome segregation ATPase